VHGGDEAAAAADIVLRTHGVGQTRRDDAGLQVDRFAPAAEEPVVRAVGDAVDLA